MRSSLDLFVQSIKRRLGSLAAILGGLDGIVFTVGIADNNARVRECVRRDADRLGLELDEAANRAGSARIS